ncbi:hypothetical protein [Paenibacillus sp. MER TA 81-3]|nr:hypothetical protein [Paenibacillus sp. MER TA 81-3]
MPCYARLSVHSARRPSIAHNAAQAARLAQVANAAIAHGGLAHSACQ